MPNGRLWVPLPRLDRYYLGFSWITTRLASHTPDKSPRLQSCILLYYGCFSCLLKKQSHRVKMGQGNQPNQLTRYGLTEAGAVRRSKPPMGTLSTTRLSRWWWWWYHTTIMQGVAVSSGPGWVALQRRRRRLVAERGSSSIPYVGCVCVCVFFCFVACTAVLRTISSSTHTLSHRIRPGSPLIRRRYKLPMKEDALEWL